MAEKALVIYYCFQITEIVGNFEILNTNATHADVYQLILPIWVAIPKAVLFFGIMVRMRTVTNILILMAGVVGSGLVAAFTVTIVAEAGGLGSCLGETCGYAALFMAFPLTWFIMFCLVLMAMLIWRRKPRRDY